MLSKEEFINYVLNAEPALATVGTDGDSDALPEGFVGFDAEESPVRTGKSRSSFALRLLEASGFGYPEHLQRKEVIRSDDAAARYLPERVYFWPKTGDRPYQTLLFESDLSHKELLEIPAFRNRQLQHLDMVEDALSRLVQQALEGFQRGGERVTADVRRGRKEETLCVVSIIDERHEEPVRLVCFGTVDASTGSLETFRINEEIRLWGSQGADGSVDQLARDHLGLLFERQFKKLDTERWQEAFTTSEERDHARRLLDVCTGDLPTEEQIQDSVLALLDVVAKSFRIKRRPGRDRRLQAFALPSDHEIGIDADSMERHQGGVNPFGGVTLRDDRNRLLGYIVYPLNRKADAEKLRSHLRQHNRFHNVLVVYPDGHEATLELWQGTEQLKGKLRRDGAHFKGAAEVVNLLSRFFVVSKARLANPTELATELAFRARYLRKLALKQLNEEQSGGPLRSLYDSFTSSLVHGQTEEEFADAYAQTLTYGLLSARWISKEHFALTGERFSRDGAVDHMPPTSPFLRNFFATVLAASFESKLTWLLDDIADLLDRTDIASVFGSGDDGSDATTDPVIHFYEPFLEAYDPQIRKARGVYFTPRPVVTFIVESVDRVLREEFGLSDGLADVTTWCEMGARHPEMQIPDGVDEDAAFVQILDPATGTGTFLVEVIDVVSRTLRSRWVAEGNDPAAIERLWNRYVPESLLPRLHAFELMIAPYAIAHLKVGLKLKESGYQLKPDDRAEIFLANTLEPPETHSVQVNALAPALAQESIAADRVKEAVVLTVLLGNPPYSGISRNTHPWIDGLLKGELPDGTRVRSYYEVDGSPLGEKKLWLQDDYVKFIRYAQWRIDSAGAGVLGFVTNHSYLDNPTFRGMRQQLLSSFTEITIVNLNGSSKRKIVCPDNSDDENVFDIGQGVAIGLFRRKPNKRRRIEYVDLCGPREVKYAKLEDPNSLLSGVESLAPESSYYFFFPRSTDYSAEYQSGWRIIDMMPINTTGVITARDAFVIGFDNQEVLERISHFRDVQISDKQVRAQYFAGKGSSQYPDGDTRGWKVPDARARVQADPEWISRCVPYQYRPFDTRSIYYVPWMVDWPREEVMSHLADREENFGLVVCRQIISESWQHAFVTQAVVDDSYVSNRSRERGYVVPLYVCAEDNSLFGEPVSPDGGKNWKANISTPLIESFAAKLGLKYLPSGSVEPENTFSPRDLFCFTYAILNSESYRSRYFEDLRVDFPRIPFISNPVLFRLLARLGGSLVDLHLLRKVEPDQETAIFVGSGDRRIVKVGETGRSLAEVAAGRGRLYINKTSYFDAVPESTWRCTVGAYQVCHKWLDDRRRAGRLLDDDGVLRFRMIVAALSQSLAVVRQIDEAIESYGGWPDAFAGEVE